MSPGWKPREKALDPAGGPGGEGLTSGTAAGTGVGEDGRHGGRGGPLDGGQDSLRRTSGCDRDPGHEGEHADDDADEGHARQGMTGADRGDGEHGRLLAAFGVALLPPVSWPSSSGMHMLLRRSLGLHATHSPGGRGWMAPLGMRMLPSPACRTCLPRSSS